MPCNDILRRNDPADDPHSKPIPPEEIMGRQDTRARFGDYSFFFQTFNAAHQGSEVTEIKAKSGAAPSTTTEKSRTEMKIEADQLSTNAQEPSEGAD